MVLSRLSSHHYSTRSPRLEHSQQKLYRPNHRGFSSISKVMLSSCLRASVLYRSHRISQSCWKEPLRFLGSRCSCLCPLPLANLCAFRPIGPKPFLSCCFNLSAQIYGTAWSTSHRSFDKARKTRQGLKLYGLHRNPKELHRIQSGHCAIEALNW